MEKTSYRGTVEKKKKKIFIWLKKT